MVARKNLIDENGDFLVKPMRLYDEEETEINYDEIEIGDIVVSKMISFFKPDRILFDVGSIRAKMSLKSYGVLNDESKDLKDVYASIGKKVLARVIGKEKGQLIIERKTIIQDTTEYLRISTGKVVDGTVETISPFGIFVDIGNGINTLLHISEISRAHIEDISKFINVGDVIKTKNLKL